MLQFVARSCDMSKIYMAQIYKKIWDENKAAMSSTRGRGRSEMVLDFKTFCDLMREDDLIVDIKTIRQKWDIMAAQGVIETMGKPYTTSMLNLGSFEIKSGLTIPKTPSDAGKCVNGVNFQEAQ